MNILFYRYGSIYEPDMIDAFTKAGLNVIEITSEITNKNLTALEQIKLVENHLKKDDIMFVFGINFYPPIAEICRIYKTIYICWTVDSPILTLFNRAITYETNRIFLFDYQQYLKFLPYNPDCIFYLPLASAVSRFDSVIASITAADRKQYSSDISFVGSLYNEKNPLDNLSSLSDFTKGYINGLTESTLNIYGYYPVKDALNSAVIEDIKKSAGSDFPVMEKSVASIDEYVISHEYIGAHIAVVERERTLNELAKRFSVNLYTRSDSSRLKNVIIHDGVRTLDEMPKVFNLSKINLNITMRPIETGLPLRCFDIMGCGGFLMTNYQAEIADFFEVGVDLETYASTEELIDKCTYYLQNDTERSRIAINGYNKVKSQHTHYHRIRELLTKVTEA